MAESLNNTTGSVLDAAAASFPATSTSCSLAQSLPNQLVKLSTSTPASSSSTRQERNASINMLENVENFCDPNWANTGFQQMEEIRRAGKLCDITLVASEHKFTAHRIVLAASIPYFHAMFMQEMIESKQEVITINSVEPNALEQFINYSYNGKICINNENVQALLIGANFFLLKNIKYACVEFIKKRLSIQDALCVRNFAEQLMCHDLVLAVNRFVNKNFNKIVLTQEFLNLSSCELADLLERDELSVECEDQVSFDSIT